MSVGGRDVGGRVGRGCWSRSRGMEVEAPRGGGRGQRVGMRQVGRRTAGSWDYEHALTSGLVWVDLVA